MMSEMKQSKIQTLLSLVRQAKEMPKTNKQRENSLVYTELKTKQHQGPYGSTGLEADAA